MSALLLVAGALQAYSSISSAQAKANQYRMAGEQASLEGKQRALQAEQQANLVLRKISATNAAANARGAAGGVQSFQGSSALIQQVNTTRGGEEFQISLENASGAERMGELQKQMYGAAASSAERSGYLNAAIALASAGYQYSQVGTAPTVPVEDRGTWSTYNSTDYRYTPNSAYV